MLDPTRPNRNIFLLYPKFLDRLLRGMAHAKEAGLVADVFEAVRFPYRQAWLYAQGRTREGQVVTRAKSGYSWHEYGLAVDIVFDGSPKEGVQWSWDGDYVGEKSFDYTKLGAILRSYGLEQLQSGGKFYDRPHFQYTAGLDIGEAFLLRQKYGIFGVWEEITERSNRK